MIGCTTSWTKQIGTNDHVMSIWNEEFEGIRGLGGLFVLTMHPQIIGRPGRLRLLGTNGQAAAARGKPSWISRCMASRIGPQLTCSWRAYSTSVS